MMKAATGLAIWAIGFCVACSDDTTSDSDGRPDPVPCGTNTCTGGDVCVVTPQEPDCDHKEDPSDTCPPDKPNDMLCGGAGMACCCGETPPSLYACDPASQCGSQVTCDCLTDACPPLDMQCSATSEPGKFLCEQPGMP